jgi:hypothetical protein
MRACSTGPGAVGVEEEGWDGSGPEANKAGSVEVAAPAIEAKDRHELAE